MKVLSAGWTAVLIFTGRATAVSVLPNDTISIVTTAASSKQMAFSASNFLPSTNGAPLATNHTFDTVKRLGYYIAQGLDLSRSDRGADTTPERSLGSTSSVSDNSGDHRDAAGPSSRSSTSVTAFHTFVHTRTIQPNATKPRTSSGRVSAAVQFLNQTATGNSTLAPTGSGYVYANACNQAIASWSSSWVYQYIPPCVTSTTDYLPAPSSQMLTECDGIPRMAANFTTPAMPIVDCAVGLLTSPSPAPKPNCTILASDCGKLLSSWSTVHSVPAGITLGLHSYENYVPGDYPRCTTNSVACTSSYLVPGADCHVGGDVSLLYWPQSRRAGICSSDEIVTMGPTIAGQPNTAVWQNLTITSPTVWIIYSSLSAVDNCENTIGPVLTSGRIPMQSTDLSTVIPWFLTNIPWDDSPSGWINIARSTGVLKAMREEWTGIDPSYLDHHVPLTVADLAQPIPAAPYYQARVFHMDNACWSGGCPTIQAWGSNYAPVLALPSIATELRPEWLTCTQQFGLMDDPPQALVSFSAEALPTYPFAADAITTGASDLTLSASPCATSSPRLPKPTPAKPFPGLSHTKPIASPDDHRTRQDPPKSDSKMSTATILPEQISAAWDNTPQSPVEGGVEHNTPDSAPMLHAPSGTQSGAAIVFGSRTLTIGGQRITSHGQIVSAASDGLIVEIPGTTVKASSNIIAELPLGTITAYASKVPLPYGHVGFVLGSQTLTVGGDPITVSAQVIQAGADGLSYQEMTTAQFVDSIASIVASGSTLLATGTVLSGGRNAAVIGSHTLTENGQAMTINGEVMSMGTGGVQVLAAASSLPLADMLLTLGSETVAVRQTVDFDGQTKMIINDHTLISGGPTAIIDGQVISLGAEGVVLEGRISTFPYQHDRQSSDSASKYELRTTAFHDEKDHASKTQIVTAVRPQSAQTTHSGSDLSQCPDSTVVAALLVAVVLVSNSFA